MLQPVPQRCGTPAAPDRADRAMAQRQRARLVVIWHVATLVRQSVTECSYALSGRCPPWGTPRKSAASLEGAGQRADDRHSDPNSGDRFPTGLNALLAAAAVRRDRAISVPAGHSPAGGRDRD